MEITVSDEKPLPKRRGRPPKTRPEPELRPGAPSFKELAGVIERAIAEHWLLYEDRPDRRTTECAIRLYKYAIGQHMLRIQEIKRNGSSRIS